jgi:hypothetical protein
MVQLAGHDVLKAKGIVLVAAPAPTHFVEDTPTAILVRQVLRAIAEFEKTALVAKLAAARRRKRMATGKKVKGRKSHAENAYSCFTCRLNHLDCDNYRYFRRNTCHNRFR